MEQIPLGKSLNLTESSKASFPSTDTILSLLPSRQTSVLSSSMSSAPSLPSSMSARNASPSKVTPSSIVSDTNRAINTLEKRLETANSKNERLHKEMLASRQECDRLRSETVSASAYRQQLERELRELQTIHMETKKQLTTMEMRFLHESGKSGTVAASQVTAAQLRAEINELKRLLEQEKAATCREMLRCEEQRAVIEVLQKSLNLKLNSDGLAISDVTPAAMNAAATVRVTELQHEVRCLRDELSESRKMLQKQINDSQVNTKLADQESNQREAQIVSQYDTKLERQRVEYEAEIESLRHEIENVRESHKKYLEMQSFEHTAQKAREEELRAELNTAHDRLAEAKVRDELNEEKDARMLDRIAQEKDEANKREREALSMIEEREKMWRERENLWRSAIDAANDEIAQLSGQIHALSPHIQDAEKLRLVLEQHESEIQRIAKGQAETQAHHLVTIAQLERNLVSLAKQKSKLYIRLDASLTAVELLTNELTLRSNHHEKLEKLLHSLFTHAEPAIISSLYTNYSDNFSPILQSESVCSLKQFSKDGISPGWTNLIEIAQEALDYSTMMNELKALLEQQREANESFRKQIEASESIDEANGGFIGEFEADLEISTQSPNEAVLAAQNSQLEREVTVLQKALRKALDNNAKRLVQDKSNKSGGITAVDAEVAAARELVRRLTEQLNEAEKETLRAKAEARNAEERRKNSANVTEELKSLLNAEKNLAKSLQKEKDALKEALASLETGVKELSDVAIQERMNYETENEELRCKVDAFSDQIAAQEAHLKVVELDNIESKLTAEKCEASNATLDAKLKDYHKREIDLRRQIVGLESVIEEMMPNEKLVAEAEQLRLENRHLRLKLGLGSQTYIPLKAAGALRHFGNENNKTTLEDADFETRVKFASSPNRNILSPSVARVTVQQSPPMKKPSSLSAATAAAVATVAASRAISFNQTPKTFHEVDIYISPRKSTGSYRPNLEDASKSKVVRGLAFDEGGYTSRQSSHRQSSQSVEMPMADNHSSNFNDRLRKIQQSFARLRATR